MGRTRLEHTYWHTTGLRSWHIQIGYTKGEEETDGPMLGRLRSWGVDIIGYVRH